MRLVVGARERVPPGEQAAAAVEGEAVVQQEGGARIVQHVLGLPEVVIQNVLHEAAEEGDVGAGTQGHVGIGHLGRAAAQRVHHNPVRAGLAGPLDPAQRDRLGRSMVGAHRENHLGIHHVVQGRRGFGDAEGGLGAGPEDAPAAGGLAVQMHDAPAAQGLHEQVLLLHEQLGTSEAGQGLGTHDGQLALVFHEALVAGLLHQGRDLAQGHVPRDVLPLRSAGTAHPRRGQAARVGHLLARGRVALLPQVQEPLPPGAQLSAREGVGLVADNGKGRAVLADDGPGAAQRAALADDRAPLLLALGRGLGGGLVIGPGGRRRKRRRGGRGGQPGSGKETSPR